MQFLLLSAADAAAVVVVIRLDSSSVVLILRPWWWLPSARSWWPWSRNDNTWTGVWMWVDGQRLPHHNYKLRAEPTYTRPHHSIFERSNQNIHILEPFFCWIHWGSQWIQVVSGLGVSFQVVAAPIPAGADSPRLGQHGSDPSERCELFGILFTLYDLHILCDLSLYHLIILINIIIHIHISYSYPFAVSTCPSILYDIIHVYITISFCIKIWFDDIECCLDSSGSPKDTQLRSRRPKAWAFATLGLPESNLMDQILLEAAATSSLMCRGEDGVDTWTGEWCYCYCRCPKYIQVLIFRIKKCRSFVVTF